MSKFIFLSDLHIEFDAFDFPIPACQPGGDAAGPARQDIDAILLAGDVCTRGRHIDAMLMIWDLWRRPVIMVKGNHDFYGNDRMQKVRTIEQARIAEMNAAGADLQVLDRETRIIGDTRIIGATLWTDTLIWDEHRDKARFHVEQRINDYKNIKFFDARKGIFRKLKVGDTLQLHAQDKAFIQEEAAKPFAGKTLVMTHHTPVTEALRQDEIAERSQDSAGYASDLWPDIRDLPIDGWISGHVHRGRSISMPGAQGPMAFLSNMRGYPEERENTVFDPRAIIDSCNFSAGLEYVTPICDRDPDGFSAFATMP